MTGTTITWKEQENVVKLHVHGDMLPMRSFNKILDIIRETQREKEIHFVVDNPKMLLLIRESIPGKYCDKLELIQNDDQMQLCADAV